MDDFTKGAIVGYLVAPAVVGAILVIFSLLGVRP